MSIGLLRRLGRAAIGGGTPISRAAAGGNSVARLAAAGGIPGCLTGWFDLTPHVISGWVEELPLGMSSGVRVEVVREGTPIATCETETKARGGRLPFTIPIEGRFSGADLVREVITVTARSRRGDTGTLKLDGATRLELIRSHLGKPVETVFDLDLSRQGNARPYLGDGWARAGEKSTWTIDDDSLIHFRSPEHAGDYLLRLRFIAFVAPTMPIQNVDIYLDEELVACFTANTTRPTYLELPVAASQFAIGGKLIFRFHHPGAARPVDHIDNVDARRLALAFSRLALVRVLGSDDRRYPLGSRANLADP